jgi:hypothetical protein
LYICVNFYRIYQTKTYIQYIRKQIMNNEGKEIRKSLAVDPATYDLLNEICQTEHRSKIDQLKVLIQKEHRRLAAIKEHEETI